MARNIERKSNAYILFVFVLMLAASNFGESVQAQCPRPGFKLALGDFSYPAGQFIARDFNGDGKMDLAASSYYGPLVIALGDGTGHFAPPSFYPVGFNALYLISGDINGDGKPDLLVAPGSGSYSLWLNDGSGGFSSVGGTQFFPYYDRPKLTDFNGDGKADFLSLNYTSLPHIVIRMGDGAGNFAAPVSYPINNLQSFVVGDFSGDGQKDIVVAINDAANRSLILYLNDGTGALVPGSPISLGTDTIVHDARDINGDGKDDIIATTARNSLTVLLSNGSGGFTRGDFPLLPTIYYLKLADFNGDGKVDVMVPYYESPQHTVNGSILMGDGQGGFTRQDYANTAAFGAVYYGDAADFNGDQMADAVMSGSAPDTSTGGLRLWQRTCNQNINTKVIDYTGDGLGDFAVWRPSTGQWIIRIRPGTLNSPVYWGLGSLGDVPVPGDYDGDGISDLAVFRAPSGGWYVLRSSDGSGYGIQWGTNGDKPAPGDYDGDGRTDFAVFRPSTGAWYILRSSDFSLASNFFGMEGDKPVQLDYDGDDKTDVAVFRPSNGYWYVLRSTDGNYTAQHFGQNGDRPVPGDYDGDSKADLGVYRSDIGFYYLRSSNNSQFASPDQNFFGTRSASDRPAPLSGLISPEMRVWRPANGWFGWFPNSHSGVIGTIGDIPVTAPYVIE